MRYKVSYFSLIVNDDVGDLTTVRQLRPPALLQIHSLSVYDYIFMFLTITVDKR
jgi:hypothetical protein